MAASVTNSRTPPAIDSFSASSSSSLAPLRSPCFSANGAQSEPLPPYQIPTRSFSIKPCNTEQAIHPFLKNICEFLNAEDLSLFPAVCQTWQAAALKNANYMFLHSMKQALEYRDRAFAALMRLRIGDFGNYIRKHDALYSNNQKHHLAMRVVTASPLIKNKSSPEGGYSDPETAQVLENQAVLAKDQAIQLAEKASLIVPEAPLQFVQRKFRGHFPPIAILPSLAPRSACDRYTSASGRFMQSRYIAVGAIIGLAAIWLRFLK